jgi:hypothetical protein
MIMTSDIFKEQVGGIFNRWGRLFEKGLGGGDLRRLRAVE